MLNDTVIVILNGTATVGKDTFIKYCEKHLHNINYKCWLVTSIEPSKAAARLLGWDGVKDDKGRAFLSELKLLSSAYYDGPIKYMMSKIVKCKAPGFIFLTIREPTEIKNMLHKLTSRHVVTALVRRSAVTHVPDNMADKYVESFSYDIIINNDDSLEDLCNTALGFVNDIIKKFNCSVVTKPFNCITECSIRDY